MAHEFIRDDFSPVGAQGRAGVAPQVFSYSTVDDLNTVKNFGYFPINSTDPVGNNMLGVFKNGDWILVSHGDPVESSIIFINNDGRDGNAITIHFPDIHGT